MDILRHYGYIVRNHLLHILPENLKSISIRHATKTIKEKKIASKRIVINQLRIASNLSWTRNLEGILKNPD